MPTYDFECQDCHKKFELFLSFAEIAKQPTIRCPECASEDVQRVWTAPVMWMHGESAASTGNRPVASGCGCNR